MLNGENIQLNKKIKFEYFSGTKYEEREIKIIPDRKVFTNKELDYTCIEIFKSDNIKKFFKIEPSLYYSNKNDFLKGNDIFILQYPNGNALSFSCGKINGIVGNKLAHSASTDNGSSGSPIIIRSDDNYVIGLHFGGNKSNNWAIKINNIFEDISKDILKPNEIICTYHEKYGKEIDLIHDYSEGVGIFSDQSDEFKKSYSEARDTNKKTLKDKIELYINNKKIKFNYKYKMKDSKEIKVTFKFKTKLTNLSYIFYKCRNLKSIDLSLLNTNNVTNMRYMF